MWNQTRCLRLCVFGLALFLTAGLGFSQRSLLETQLTLQVNNKSIEGLLAEIERSYSILFSYNSDIIPDDLHNVNVVQVSLGDVLEQIFGHDYYFKSTGRYVIILRRHNAPRKSEERKALLLTGEIMDHRTMSGIGGATIYDMGSMQSTLSDSHGRFTLSMVPKTLPLGLRGGKLGYMDTVLMVSPVVGEPLKIYLSRIKYPIIRLDPLELDTFLVEEPFFREILPSLVSREARIHSLNVIVFDHRPVQLSLLPTLGTNLKLHGAVVNRFSLNLLAGYSAGVAGFEAGGIANLTREDVIGFQMGGILNLTGRNLHGMQTAGIMNQVGGKMNGTQLAGVLNICQDSVRGGQMAGVMNVSQNSLHGFQLSSFMNIVRGKEAGWQIAGVYNYAPRPKVQFGVINVADTANGIPVGVINLIKGGYYAVSMGTDELYQTNFLVNMGTTRLYSIVGLTSRFPDTHRNFGFVYGLGSILMPERRVNVYLEIMSSVTTAFGRFDSRTMSRVSLSPQLSMRINKHLRFRIGPSINTMLADAFNPDVEVYLSAILPENTHHFAPRATRFDTWLGGYAGINYIF